MPEVKARRAAAAKKIWDDPEKRAALLAARREKAAARAEEVKKIPGIRYEIYVIEGMTAEEREKRRERMNDPDYVEQCVAHLHAKRDARNAEHPDTTPESGQV
jgi:hypothetical protein